MLVIFLIRNEEDYINKRTNTGEKKETKEREKHQGKDERSFLHKYQRKTPNNRTLKTKETPSIFKLLKRKPQSN